MAYAITQTCCSDATCVSVCPVNCIHPTPEERAFGSTEMLYVDPRTCIDCGACADACPVDAIFPVDSLTGGQQEYAAINADWYADTGEPQLPQDSPIFHAWNEPSFPRTLPADFPTLRVAVVGTGPAGMYAVEDLLLHTNAQVTLIDRLPVPGGLMRFGVAPDHPATRKMGDAFARFHTHPRVRMHLGVEIGRDVTVEDVAAHHDAVIYATGASTGRRLDIPGADLTGSMAVSDFVSWYNGRPGTPSDAVGLAETERVAVVGNGNVALDAARILLADPQDLAKTGIAAHALRELRAGSVSEVVLLARRGPEHAAYTASELHALKHLPGVDLVVDDHDPRTAAAIDAAAPRDKAALLQDVPREPTDYTRPTAGRRRLVLRFHTAPERVTGDGGVRAVRVGGESGETDIPAGLLLHAIGYLGTPIPGLPFDEDKGTIPHRDGRITGHPGSYTVGWIKRGPTGGIGANRACARQTVDALLEDAADRALPTPPQSSKKFRRLARRRSSRTPVAAGQA